MREGEEWTTQGYRGCKNWEKAGHPAKIVHLCEYTRSTALLK